MRIRKKKWAEPELEKCDFFIKNPTDFKGKWQSAFKNKAPLYVELGCGKGGFVAEFGIKHRDVNMLAIDIKKDMLGVARRNIVKVYEENNISIDNILLVAYNIEQVLDILSEEDCVERIYINFCNPWPRPKHKKRRLTYVKKLEMYKKFLKPEGEIFFKTDDDELFRESIVYFKEAGFKILELSENYKNEADIITEHQQMFEREGKTTKFLHATI